MTDELHLDVRIDGFGEPIGTLVRNARSALTFTYRTSHLARPGALPLSLSLPLTDEPYGDVLARAFFGNLLQERDGTLTQIMLREGLTRDDIAGLLFHVGKDCAGALSVLPGGAPPVKLPGDLRTDYTPLREEQVIGIVTALRDRRRLPTGTTDPSPLAGVQSKIALVELPNGELAQPHPDSGAPTTHILKVPDRDHPRDAKHEAAAMDLSRSVGADTSEARLIEIGGVEALLVRRFDRSVDEYGRIVRLHQEDFAQALGLPSLLKYERNGKEGRRFDVAGIRKVLEATVEPVAAKESFAFNVFFDLLTGNVDNHAKNFAIMHIAPNVIAPAPRYDVLPTRLDPDLTDEFAFRIGNATKLDGLTRADLDAFLAALGIATVSARKRLLGHHLAELATGLAGTFGELAEYRMKPFADLIAANMRKVLPLAGIDVPEAARERDAFIARGGGWGS